MTYVVLKGYLHDPIDCVKRAVATEPGRIYRKDGSISILLVFYYPTFCLCSVDRGERELSGKRIVT
ncbi:hypothetical protein AHAS_AhasUnG0147200 [Arachis hypogaea]